MFFFKNHLLKFYDEVEDGNQQTNSAMNGTTPRKRLGLSDVNSIGYPMDRDTRKSRMGLFHGHSKIQTVENDKAEEPVAMLPAALVEALVGVREEKIHDLESVISSIREKYEQAKLMYSANLRIYWSLGGTRGEKSLGNNCKKLYRPPSAPTLQWGRRKQLASLLETKSSAVQTWRMSREDPFSEFRQTKVKKSTLRSPRNDLEVQLWVWMDEADDMQGKLMEMKTDRDSLKEELQSSLEKEKILESLLNTLKINEAKEKIRTLKIKEEMEKACKCLEECKTKYEQALLSKEEELSDLSKTLAVQAETLRKLQDTCDELQVKNEHLEKNRKEKEQLLIKLEILDDQLQERQIIMETVMEDANQKMEWLAQAKENFKEQVERWQREANCIREEIAGVERERDNAEGEAKRLESEVVELEARCRVLQEEVASTQWEVQAGRERMALMREQCSQEVRAREEAERMMEQEAERMQGAVQCLEGELQEQRQRSEGLAQQLEEERLKTEGLMEDLERERTERGRLEDTLQEQRKEEELNCDLLQGEKQNLLAQLESEVSVRQNLEMEVKALKDDLSTERVSLQKTRAMLNKEILKNEEANRLLSESMSEVLKKERTIKMLRGDSTSKEKSLLQMKFKYESLHNKKQNGEDFLEEYRAERLKREELTKAHESLMNQLTEVKKHCDLMRRDLMSKEESLLQMKQKYESIQNKKQNSEDFLEEYRTERLKCEELIKAHDSVMNQLTEVKKRCDLMEKTHTASRNSLEAKIIELQEELRSKNLRMIREDILKQIFKRRILALEEGVDKETNALQGRLTHIGEENVMLREQLSRERQSLKEQMQAIETQYQTQVISLERQNKELAESTACLQQRLEEQCRTIEVSLRSRCTNLEEQNTELKAKVSRGEEQVQELSALVEAERCKQVQVKKKFEALGKEHEAWKQEAEVRWGKEREQLLKDRQHLSEDLEFLVGQGGAGDRRTPVKEAEERLQGMQEYHQRVLGAVCTRNVAREAAIKQAAKLEVAKVREEMEQAWQRRVQERRVQTRDQEVQAEIGEGEEGRHREGSVGKDAALRIATRYIPEVAPRDEISRENIRVTKSDGRFAMGGKNNYHSPKQNVEAHLRQYFNHVKNNFKNEVSLGVVHKGVVLDGRKDNLARRVAKKESSSKWQPAAREAREPTPPSDGPGKGVKPATVRREKTMGGSLVQKVEFPKPRSLQEKSRRDQKPASRTVLIENIPIKVTLRPKSAGKPKC
ncbi:trichohyalin-like [Ischnura elegans]|uniref:trichohyalin-like n=1 Tax=Ischnura elegans TaxID=197161 RepID=UPI001ED8A913|nr:trichohyalin-like [Ischnura elegans]